MVDKFKVDLSSVKSDRFGTMYNAQTGDKYFNVYRVWGQGTSNVKRYDFNLRINFDKNNVKSDDAKYQILDYFVTGSSHNHEFTLVSKKPAK